jgi:hypothetical protein
MHGDGSGGKLSKGCDADYKTKKYI